MMLSHYFIGTATYLPTTYSNIESWNNSTVTDRQRNRQTDVLAPCTRRVPFLVQNPKNKPQLFVLIHILDLSFAQ